MIENEDIAVELVEQMAEARRFAPKTACGYKSVARQWCAYIGSTPFAAATEEDAAGSRRAARCPARPSTIACAS